MKASIYPSSVPAATKVDELQSFAYAPGWSTKKLQKVYLEGLNTLSFFDVPVKADGSLDKESLGYQNFREVFPEIKEKAQDKRVKVTLTLTATNNETLKKVSQDPGTQKKLIGEALSEVKDSNLDGINLDFEFPSSLKGHQNGFTKFVGDFSREIHNQIPGSFLTVAIPSSLTDSQWKGNLRTLSQKADNIYLVADNFAVLESNHGQPDSPKYGVNENTYWDQTLQIVSKALKNVPQEKVVLERAWYGNGSDYPFSQAGREDKKDSFTLAQNYEQILTASVDKFVSVSSEKTKASVKRNLPTIIKALKDESILDPYVLSYAIATIEHETASSFEPIEEIKGRRSAKRLGYEGGSNYFGRGFIQLTHLRNYKKIGERIGLGEELVKNPDLALKPDVSAKILAAFFKDNGVARLAHKGNFSSARKPVNPDAQADKIANQAQKYLKAVKI